ncbi:MAG: hypothetical protein II969_16640 [Anaerolineaceae bacterium]|nr:hypothetical protein [Anaerolineaceae bacterium]
MDREQGEKLLNEMQTVLSDDSNNVSADDAMLPFESLDDFSTDPVEFNEMAKTMLTRVEAVFDKAVKYNRHSKQYIKTAVQLEKGIKFLASCCLTKIALTMNKTDYPELGQLSTEKLYRMASFHYRKINAALDEYQAKNNDLDDVLLEMQYRYFNLLGRLRSTEVRIYKYQDKRIFGSEDETLIVHGHAFSEKSWTRKIHKQYSEPASFHQPASFSPMTAYLPENGKAAAERPSALPEPSAEVQGNVVIPKAENLEETSGNGVSETVVDETQNCSPSDTEMNQGTLQKETTDDASQENNCSEENDPFESKTSDENPVPESSGYPSEGMIIPEEDRLITVAPTWQEIVQNAIDTRGLDENGGISLTIPEMCSVLCDDNFERDVPDLAGQFRQMIAEYDPGDG